MVGEAAAIGVPGGCLWGELVLNTRRENETLGK